MPLGKELSINMSVIDKIFSRKKLLNKPVQEMSLKEKEKCIKEEVKKIKDTGIMSPKLVDLLKTLDNNVQDNLVIKILRDINSSNSISLSEQQEKIATTLFTEVSSTDWIIRACTKYYKDYSAYYEILMPIAAKHMNKVQLKSMLVSQQKSYPYKEYREILSKLNKLGYEISDEILQEYNVEITNFKGISFETAIAMYDVLMESGISKENFKAYLEENICGI